MRTDINNFLKNSPNFACAALVVFFTFSEKITLYADVLDSFDSTPKTTKEITPQPRGDSEPDKNAPLKKSEEKAAGNPVNNNAKPINSGRTKTNDKNKIGENTTISEEPKPSKLTPGAQNKNLPINLSSDGVSALKEMGTIELEKNVLITQGDLSLKSSKARVYFVNDGNEVQKIVAEGDVQVDKFDEISQKPIHASGKKMTFLNDKQIIILEGNAKISRGKDNMRGNMITYDIKSGQIKAEKIETVVYPEENQIKKP